MTQKKELIHHCLPYLPKIDDGGMSTYINSILAYQSPYISPHIINSLKDVDQAQHRLLHIHVQSLLYELTGECPVVYTHHNHSSYCPSGSKYFAASKRCCDRNISYWGCTYGNWIERCGSRRPWIMLKNMQNSFDELEILKKLRVLIIVNSNYVRNQLIANGLPCERVITLKLGIQLPKVSLKPLTSEIHQKQRILFVGRIVPEKGLEWLLQSLKLVPEDVHLDVAGDGWEKPKMEKLSNKLGLGERVKWHGWCNRDTIRELYQQCFAVIFPSIWPEPAGLVTLEAYSHFRPIIASSTGGIPEYIRDGETGLLVQPNDIQSLASKISDLATNFNKGKILGEMGYSYLVKEFLIDIHINKLEKIYDKAITIF
jgi:glycosyltransferase involved in cell wall biosynthesis